jgi:hypothetical protein
MGICFPLMAQLEKNTRLELPVSSSGEQFRDVFPLGNDGLLLLSRNNPYYERRNQWLFSRYDTNLKMLWTKEYRPDFKYSPVMAFHNADYGYWLFVVPDTEKYMFLQVNLHDGTLDVREGELLAGLDVHQFKVLSSKALIAGYYRGRPVVVVHSFFDRSTKVLPGLFEKNMEINNVDIDEVTGNINVLTYAFRKKHCQFEIKTYDYEGRQIKNTILRDERNSFISGQIVPLDDVDSYLIGNYSVGCTQYSQGLYLAHLDDAGVAGADFIEFSELQNFFNYMKPRKKQRVLEKIGKRKSMGKENRFRYRLLVHDLIENEDEIILVAEVYYPNYRTSTAPYMIGGTFSRNYVRMEDGYRYTHAIVCGFDKNGKLKWDNSFTLKNLLSNRLQEMVQLTRAGEYYVLAYPDEKGIHAEVIHRNKTVIEQEKFEIGAGADYEKVINQESSSILAWYDQYFMSYGIQKVGIDRQNRPGQYNLPETNHREVFYIQKLSYNFENLDTDGKLEAEVKAGR